MKHLKIFVLVLLSIFISTEGNAGNSQSHPDNTLKIGVLAKRGHSICAQRWQPTAAYLTETIPDYSFEIVPLGFDELLPAISRGEIDFMLANSAYYVMAEKQYFVLRLATLNTLRLGTTTTSFAGVLFTRADASHIECITDLKGKSFAAVDPLSLGGWLAGRYELVRRGINPEKDLGEISFLGTHDAVVEAVRNGKVAGGTVRSDALERLEAEGVLKLTEFKILDQHHSENCKVPFVHSTRNYPEWPFAQLNHIDDELASRVTASLLRMPRDCPAATASHSAGWHTPVAYQAVRLNLQQQNIGPWADYGKVSLREVIADNLPVVIPGLILGFLLIILTFKLNHSRLSLRALAIQQQNTLQLHEQAKLDLEKSNSRLLNTLEKLHQEEARLVQSEKLATVGQVAAGVAHEINNPIGFIMSNLSTLQNYLKYMVKLTNSRRHWIEAAESRDEQAMLKWSSRIDKLLAEEDPEFIREDGDSLIEESLSGAVRIKKIVQNLKEMAQIGTDQWCPLNLNEGIKAVHGVAEGTPGFQGNILLDLHEIPEFQGHLGELNQVFLNLLTNAIRFSPESGDITVSSLLENDLILIRVTDSGPGIPLDHEEQIFNPFFTTLPTGEGPGLGLSLSRTIVNRHGGTLVLDNTEEQGSSFLISLPVVSQRENVPAGR